MSMTNWRGAKNAKTCGSKSPPTSRPNTTDWSREGAADVVDFLADDGLPVCADPPDIADDGLLVVVWPRMYQEAA
jgi:hypothetical protein